MEAYLYFEWSLKKAETNGDDYIICIYIFFVRKILLYFPDKVDEKKKYISGMVDIRHWHKLYDEFNLCDGNLSRE